MDDTHTHTEGMAKTLSRRSILKGSMTLTAAAIGAPALVIGAVEIAPPLVERAAVQVTEWYEEVGGI